MTYNIRHAEGMDGRISTEHTLQDLQKGHPDIIALQEVDRLQWRSGLQDQARYFARALGMYYAYEPAITKGLSEYGVALLSRYPLEQVQRRILGGGREPRCVLTAQVHVGGTLLTVATTHLGVNEEDRQQQLPKLESELLSIHTPLLLMGDFNTGSSDPQLSKLIQQLGLHELSLSAPIPTVLSGGEFDHIFTTWPVQGNAWTEVGGASDHLPVLGSLMLTPS